MSFLSLSAVHKSFGGLRVVNHVNLEVARGEFFALLGPSGCGKTTLLRMIAGFCELDSGEIRFGDKRIDRLPAHVRDIGMVFQNYAVFPNLSVADNVAYGLRARKTPAGEIAKRVDEALALVRLAEYGKRKPHQLSGGQLQRVAIARALVIRPQVLLFDEPLSNLDARLRVSMRAEIRELQKSLGITAIYVTHDQEEAMSVSDRIAVFNDGIVQQIDKPDALYERPVNSFVANFVGENNVLAGTVETIEQGFCRVALASGGSVVAQAVNVAAAGAATSLSVRPERISILTNGVAHEGPNRLPATVQNTIYLGDHALAVLEAAGNAEFMVKLQPGVHEGLSHGQSVSVTFRPEDCLALDPVSFSKT